MLFNKNIILSILQDQFEEDIQSYVDDTVMKLDVYDLEGVFDSPVDYAILGDIDEITVEEYAIEDDEDNRTISGTIEIEVTVDGFSHWDNDSIFIGSERMTLGFLFRFFAETTKKKKVKYTNLELEYIY